MERPLPLPTTGPKYAGAPASESQYQDVEKLLTHQDYSILQILYDAAQTPANGCTRSQLCHISNLTLEKVDASLSHLATFHAINSIGSRGKEVLYGIGPIGNEYLSRHNSKLESVHSETKPMRSRATPKPIPETFAATVFRVLIASPSDVAAERDAIEEVINDWNVHHSEEQKVILLPIRWEKSATPEMGDNPQSILNRQLVDKCQILLGVFWGRIGTKTKNAESGTVEEIEQFIASKRPAMLYFSGKSIPQSKLDTKQYERLKTLKRNYQPRGIIWSFKSLPELREQISRHLTATVNKMSVTANPLASS